ncbi:serine hydrolase domain-containing protein [Kitasatospora sp. MAP5-34]|uniref:serine hydrolase domain-containing protein n=1 Tax=Kitasatospora sp. MAP5-34 TaxID=3035102 RepID=UPI0024735158|nr:serine hydrolase domain-containing protein [Kitasatospora sp. MAP5-34]MDH6576623.1 D-alanyl-D-alanine carboxypeptidase [Kitasatospora sp. MAP5-34]
MNTRLRRSRWTTLAASGALLVALTAGAAAPAFAAGPAGPAASDVPAASATQLPPLDAAALSKAISGLPNADVTGALVRVTGGAGKWSGTSGSADLTTGQKVSADGSFRIGSISKVFTATVALQLVAEHRLDLDGTVQQYLPGVLPAGYPAVTVGQLLNHTSGLPIGDSSSIWGDGSNQWFVDHRMHGVTPEQVVADGLTYPMEFQPGTAQEYNGLNTFIAGMIVEKVTGQTFAHEVQTRIARPLGLHRTYVPEATDTRLPGPHAHGYLTVTNPDGTTREADVTEQSPWPWAEGGMISTAPELDRFMTALFRGRLLPPAQQALLFTVPDVPNHHNKNCAGTHACFSTGLMSATLPGGTVIWGKTGSRPGYTSGMFATRDGSRHLVYSINPTGLTGAEAPYIMRIAMAAFGPSASS